MLVLVIFLIRIISFQVEGKGKLACEQADYLNWECLRETSKSLGIVEAPEWILENQQLLDKPNICEIVPKKLSDKVDVNVIQLFGSKLSATESCLERIILLLINADLPVALFRSFIYTHKDWVPEKFWSEILLVINQTNVPFPKYYMSVLNCFPYLEVMAGHFRPAFEGSITSGNAGLKGWLVRLTPIYFILKKPDSYSQKLCKEFTNIIKPDSNESPVEYLEALELYLRETGYIRRAMSNERDYFNINQWLIVTFLFDPTSIGHILRHDWYHLAYIALLPGVSSTILNEMVDRCSMQSLALILGRVKPKSLKLMNGHKVCSRVKALVQFYTGFLSAAQGVVPCRPRGQNNNDSMMIQLQLKSNMFKNWKDSKYSNDNFVMFHMLMNHLFDVPMDFLSKSYWERGRRYLGRPDALANSTLQKYCNAFDMNPAVLLLGP